MDGWKRNEPLAPHTTFKIGGPAEYFCEVTSEEELELRVREANAHDLKVTILGGGSNVLIDDEGIRGAVIVNAIRGIDETEREDAMLLSVGAGELFDDLVAHTVLRGYWGLENLSHIPGSVGATPIQNVGAYGVEVAEHIESVRAFDQENGTWRTFTNAACAFGYRDSIFKHEAGAAYAVTAVTFALSTAPRPRLSYKDLAERFATREPSHAEIRDAVIEIRSKKFPDWRIVGTAGSFFKNPVIPAAQYEELQNKYPDLPGFPIGAGKVHPVRDRDLKGLDLPQASVSNGVKVPLGFILDKICGLRGVRDGNVGTYEGQALVVVNHGGATACEVESFARMIAAKVFDVTNVHIDWEVTWKS